MKAIYLTFLLLMTFSLASCNKAKVGTPEYFNEQLTLAEEGDEDAQLIVAKLYEKGRGVEESKRDAAKWYLEAAKQGVVESQYMTGIYYLQDRGYLSKSIPKHWFQLAAKHGHPGAQYELGKMFEENGVWAEGSWNTILGGRNNNRWIPNPDYKQAMEWYLKAANQGNEKAQYSLGSLYVSGNGVKLDSSEAMKWYQLAADQGYEMAIEAIDQIKNKGLPRKQIETSPDYLQEAVTDSTAATEAVGD